MSKPEWLTNYCNDHGYTDPEFIEGQWWAFPPNGVMRSPIDHPRNRASIPYTPLTEEELQQFGEDSAQAITAPRGVIINMYETLSATADQVSAEIARQIASGVTFSVGTEEMDEVVRSAMQSAMQRMRIQISTPTREQQSDET